MLQLGGHSDGEMDTVGVAKREALEESGLPVKVLSDQIFDIDIHKIPSRKDDPAHEHFDIRFMLQAQRDDFVVSAESVELAWVLIEQLESYTNEELILRMRRKWRAQSLPTALYARAIAIWNDRHGSSTKLAGIMPCDWRAHTLGLHLSPDCTWYTSVRVGT